MDVLKQTANKAKKAWDESLKRALLYAKALFKWTYLSLVIGILCGIAGTAFHVAVEKVTDFRAGHGFILFLLPAAGLLIVFLYKTFKTEGVGTDHILTAVQSGGPVSALLFPSIFIGAVLTHLCGGSAGREGAALQMGGTIGYHTAGLFKADDRDRRTCVMAGMAAFFSALFGTPLAAAVFAVEVVSVGLFYHVALLPCLMAALISYGVSLLLGVAPTRFALSAPALTLPMALRVAVLGVLLALLSMFFCFFMHLVHKAFHRIKNAWLAAVIGGLIVIALTLLVGNSDYNGAGMGVIQRAIEGGEAFPAAFLLKIVFTAVTLASGYKGGEVVPSFFVGACFGCVAAPLLGISASFGAALGLIGVFCGAVNCPLASIFLAIELFGGEGVPYFALICVLTYILSGYNGLYSSQRLLYSKHKALFIDARTNAWHDV